MPDNERDGGWKLIFGASLSVCRVLKVCGRHDLNVPSAKELTCMRAIRG